MNDDLREKCTHRSKKSKMIFIVIHCNLAIVSQGATSAG